MSRLSGRIISALRTRLGNTKRAPAIRAAPAKLNYAEWVRRHSTIGSAERQRLKSLQAALPARPQISVLIEATGASSKDITESLHSLEDQTYDAWQAIVVSPPEEFAPRATGARVQVVGPRGAGSLVELVVQAAGGDLVVLLDAGDRLSPAALGAIAIAFVGQPHVHALYSDEDRLDGAGTRSDPWLKGAWSRDQVLAQAYTLRLGALRREVFIAAIDAEPDSFASNGPAARSVTTAVYAAWVWLATQQAPPIVHLPFVLYHRRATAPLAEPPVFSEVVRSSGSARRHALDVLTVGDNGWRHVVWPTPSPPPRISLCIPTRDRLQLLSTCVEGLRHSTKWPNLEIIVIDNGSVEAETLSYLTAIAADSRVKVLRDDGEFNFSRLNNLGASAASGQLLGLINNDLAVKEPGWLREMASHAVRPDVGAVGALLHYGNDTVQHAGVVIGIGGVASHIHKGLPAGQPGYQGRVAIVQDVSCVTAACLLTRLEFFRKLGGLDETEFPVAYNDVDFCLRVREQGLRIIFTPHVQLYHLESASRGRDHGGARGARLDRDKAAMQRRWGNVLIQDPFYSPNLSNAATDCRLAFPPRTSPLWAEVGA